ncbi:MAG: twin-arginine translocase subunit TatC [Gammaproteobacteria bacterium]|nr:twin-arginine translocase subunit TatC [Gammaproteobacteria bacterium]
MASGDEKVFEEQGFLSHLIELRDRLLKCVLAVGLIFIVMVFFRQDIYAWLANPLVSQLTNQQMIATDVATTFLTPFKLALMVSIFLAVPVLLYQMWAFVAPGLYIHEKQLIAPLLISSTLLFYTGVAFAYYVVFPLMFRFFVGQEPVGVAMMPDIRAYLDFVITIFFAFGIAFEVPVATVLVVVVGITTPENLVKIRPYIFVGAFIIGMFLTPPDMISQTLLALPMWLLYEVGIVFSRMYKKRIQAASEAKDTLEDEMREREEQAQQESKVSSERPKGSYRNSLTDSMDDDLSDHTPEDLGP